MGFKKVKIKTEVNKIWKDHCLIPMKVIKPELKNPRFSCGIFKTSAYYQCSCTLGLCLKCYAQHCLEQQSRKW